MERIIKIISKLFLVLIILGITVSCRDPLDLMEKLEDDVKLSNGLYLEIVSISPAENSQGVNPGEEIRIEFDRAIDLTSFEENFSLVDVEGNSFESDFAGKSLSFNFNKSTNILTIAADPYLDGLIEYKMDLLDKVKGEDGSVLREGVSTSFKTSDAPRGGFRILDEYNNSESATVDVEISSQGATYYILATTEAGLDSAGWQEITSGKMIVKDVPIAGTQGKNTLYLRLRDGSVSEAGSATKSNIETSTVIYDTVAPTISFPDSYTYSKNDTQATLTATVTDANGLSSYLWKDVNDDGIEITSSSSLTTKASKGTDGTYTLTLTATDLAGNITSSSELYYMVDSVGPVLNIGSSFNTPTATDLNLDLTASDDDSGISSYDWKMLSSPGSYELTAVSSEDRKLRVSAEGTYIMAVTAYDRAGNSTYKEIDIICDNSLPTVRIPESIYYENSSITIDATVTDADTVLWTADSGNISFGSPSNNSTTVSASAEGSYQIKCTVTKTGTGSASATSTFIWDTTAPVVSISTSPLYANYNNSNPTISAAASDGTGGSGVKNYVWSQSAGSGTMSFSSPNSNTSNITMSQEGTDYEAQLVVTDNAGNAATVTRPVVRDTIAPGIPAVSYTSPTSDNSPLFSLTAASGESNLFSYSYNGSNWSNTSSTSISLYAIDGDKNAYGGDTVYFRARDVAGNVSSTVQKFVVAYPVNSLFPADGATLSGDLAWNHFPGKYYKVFTGSAGNLPTTAFGSYRSLPYVDSTEIGAPPVTVTMTWRVGVYSRIYNRITRKWEYTLDHYYPTKGYFSFVALKGRK